MLKKVPVRFLSLLLLTALFACLFPVLAEETYGMPAWEYPLSPEIIADRRGYLTLANKSSLLAKDYVPGDLVDITARCAVKGQLRTAANDALQAMFDAAEADGYKLYVKSSYRSYKTQNTMYYSRLEKVGHDDGFVAMPGSSDHQTGLGVDVLNYAWTKKEGMNSAFGREKEAQWMAEHCYEFGFVIRYMEDKEDITEIRYEPWHIRYVGPEAAAYMKEMHFSLEEFTQDWQSYVAGWESRGGDLDLLVRQRAMPDPVIIVGFSEDAEPDICIYYTQEDE
ncbi:MAG: hypothetical protein CW338_05825 [Clostridiales bacterium]|nr:hypothetical protein [Clostridiales bacterium]